MSLGVLDVLSDFLAKNSKYGVGNLVLTCSEPAPNLLRTCSHTCRWQVPGSGSYTEPNLNLTSEFWLELVLTQTFANTNSRNEISVLAAFRVTESDTAM